MALLAQLDAVYAQRGVPCRPPRRGRGRRRRLPARHAQNQLYLTVLLTLPNRDARQHALSTKWGPRPKQRRGGRICAPRQTLQYLPTKQNPINHHLM